jgi:hypothetical protein
MNPKIVSSKYLFQTTPSGIFIPMIRNEKTKSQAFGELFGVSSGASWSLIYEKKPTWNDVIEQLTKYDLHTVLNRLMCLSIECNTRENDQQIQKKLLYGLLRHKAEDLWNSAYEKLVKTGEAKTVNFFFDLQLINAARVAIQFCKIKVSNPPDNLEAFTHALLMITDLLNPPSESDGSVEEMGKFLRVNMLAQHQGKFAHRLARAYLLHAGIDESGQSDDFSKRLTSLTQLPPRLVLAAGHAIFSILASFSEKDIIDGNVLISKDRLFSSFDFLPEEVEKMWNLSCSGLSEIKNELIKNWNDGDPNPFDLLPFQKKPLIEVEDCVYCPSIPLLFSRFAEGLHYFQLSKNEEDNRNYFRILGYRFEQYVDNLICTVRGGHGPITGYDRDPIGDPKEQITRYGDGVIAYKDEAILIEVKSGFLDQIAVSKGYSERFERFFNDAIIGGAIQLKKLMERAEDGKLLDIGVDPKVMNRYYPVLILQQPFFDLTIYEKLRATLKDKGILIHEKSAPIQLIDIGSFEYLIAEAECGTEILSIIRGKTDNVTWRDFDMTRYLYNRYGRLRYCKYLEKQYNRVIKKILNEFQTRRKIHK